MAGGSSSVNVNFRVTGGEVQSYMDRIQQRAMDMSRSLLRNAAQQSDSAKEQLKSYQEQLRALDRKLRTENELAKVAAQINRDARLNNAREDINQKYQNLDDDFRAGNITKKQHRLGVEQLDNEDKTAEQDVNDQYRQDLNAAQEEHRDNMLMLRTMRDNVDTVRNTSQQELAQMRKGDESLEDAIENDDDPNRTLDRLSSESREGRKDGCCCCCCCDEDGDGDGDGGGSSKSKESTFGAMLKALAVNKVGGLVAGMPQAENELDYVKPIAAMIGLAVGGLAGNIIDMANVKVLGSGLGNSSFAALGMELGEKAGEFAGGALERSFKARDALTSANYRTQALTGMNMGIDSIGGANGVGGTGLSAITSDLAKYGADFKTTAELQYKIASAQGTSKNLNGGAENALALRQGLGIGEDTFLSLTELLRSSKDQNRDVMRLVGGVAAAGKSNIFAGDRTFLSEFMQKNFTNLQKTLLSTQNEVASGTTFDILKRFDSIGGPFAARDSRSQGLINTVQGSLTNPGSNNLKALSFMSLREQNPEMDFERLLEEQQKGLSSPAYLKTMLSMVDRLGGDQSMRIMNTAQMLGLGDNLAAARKLYNNRDKLMSGQISSQELIGSGEYSEDSIRQLGQDQTSVYTQSTAEIQNAFLESAIQGIEVVGTKMVDLFGDMMDATQEYVNAKFLNMMNGTSDDPSIKNTTHRPRGRGANVSSGGW